MGVTSVKYYGGKFGGRRRYHLRRQANLATMSATATQSFCLYLPPSPTQPPGGAPPVARRVAAPRATRRGACRRFAPVAAAVELDHTHRAEPIDEMIMLNAWHLT